MGAGIGILPGSVLCRVLFLIVVGRIEAVRRRRVNRYRLRRGEAAALQQLRELRRAEKAASVGPVGWVER
jgi:hypothetical protein